MHKQTLLRTGEGRMETPCFCLALGYVITCHRSIIHVLLYAYVLLAIVYVSRRTCYIVLRWGTWAWGCSRTERTRYNVAVGVGAQPAANTIPLGPSSQAYLLSNRFTALALIVPMYIVTHMAQALRHTPSDPTERTLCWCVISNNPRMGLPGQKCHDRMLSCCATYICTSVHLFLKLSMGEGWGGACYLLLGK